MTRVGNENPKYRATIADLQNATTDLDATYQEYKILARGSLSFTEDGYKKYSDDSDGVQLSTVSGQIPAVDASVIADATAKCRSKYYGRLAELRRSFGGQQVLGEIRETLGFIRRPWKTGLELLTALLTKRQRIVREINSLYTGSQKAIRRTNPRRDIRRLMGALADVWLEARFVVLPLMNDIEGFANILKRSVTFDEVNSYRVYGAAIKSSVTLTSYGKIYGVNYRGQTIPKFMSEHIIRFGYRTRVLSSTESMLEDARQSFLNVRDIPGTVWELTPWSFLVDYFVNIGGVIEGVFETQENVVWTSESTVNTREVRYVTDAAVPVAPRYVVTKFSPCDHRYRDRSVQRRAAPIGMVPLTFSLPRSDVRLANIAALLTGLLNSNHISR